MSGRTSSYDDAPPCDAALRVTVPSGTCALRVSRLSRSTLARTSWRTAPSIKSSRWHQTAAGGPGALGVDVESLDDLVAFMAAYGDLVLTSAYQHGDLPEFGLPRMISNFALKLAAVAAAAHAHHLGPPVVTSYSPCSRYHRRAGQPGSQPNRIRDRAGRVAVVVCWGCGVRPPPVGLPGCEASALTLFSHALVARPLSHDEALSLHGGLTWWLLAQPDRFPRWYDGRQSTGGDQRLAKRGQLGSKYVGTGE
jgi:hypothetical protein